MYKLPGKPVGYGMPAMLSRALRANTYDRNCTATYGEKAEVAEHVFDIQLWALSIETSDLVDTMSVHDLNEIAQNFANNSKNLCWTSKVLNEEKVIFVRDFLRTWYPANGIRLQQPTDPEVCKSVSTYLKAMDSNVTTLLDSIPDRFVNLKAEAKKHWGNLCNFGMTTSSTTTTTSAPTTTTITTTATSPPTTTTTTTTTTGSVRTIGAKRPRLLSVDISEHGGSRDKIYRSDHGGSRGKIYCF